MGKLNWMGGNAVVLLVLLFVMFTGCATQTVTMSVMRPAEVNLKGFDKIAIGEIEGSGARDIADALTTELVNSGRFQVLDRAHIDTILHEHSLNMQDIFDESTRPQLGKFFGATVMVFGRVQTDQYKEDPLKKGEPWKDKEGKWHTSYTREGSYTLNVNLQIVDLSTGAVKAVKNLQMKDNGSKYADNAEPDPIDKVALRTNCINGAVATFMKAVAPYSVQVKASFQKDELLPELESAITQMKIGEWEEALNILQECTRKNQSVPKVQAKAFYNLGLAQMYRGDPDNALGNFKQAMKLQPSEKRYQDAIVECKAEKERQEKLQQQT